MSKIVAIPKNNKHQEYVGYAKHCLQAAARLPDRKTRIILREMAAEWTALAGQAATQDVALRPQARSAKRPGKARS
jgi:DNA primase